MSNLNKELSGAESDVCVLNVMSVARLKGL